MLKHLMGLACVFFAATSFAMAPVCSLSVTPVVIASGANATLTASCNPAASSYTWSNSGFSQSAASGQVSPTAPTLYTVVGHNAAGSSTPASAAVYVCNTPPQQNYNPLTLGGTTNNDQIASSIANDTVDGDLGVDTVMYNCNRSSFTVTKDPKTGGWAVSSAAEGLDTLNNIERIHFGDETLALDISGNAGQVYRLYQAAFNRKPDNDGLKYWIGRMDNGTSLHEVAAGFVYSAEFQTLYGSNPSNADFLTRLYSNVLHRVPDPGGYAWWMEQLDSGQHSRITALTGFSESPENQAAVLDSILNGIDLRNNDSTPATPSSMGEIRLMLTLTGRTIAQGDPKCTYPNTTYPNQGYYCSLVETIRSAISSDGIHFYLEESEWFKHGDMMDPAWGVGSDGIWRLISSTTSTQGVRDGRLRYTESESCPNFPGSGSKGNPSDQYFREATADGKVIFGGAPSIADSDGEARAYFGVTDGIGMATITGGQLQPYAKNPVLRVSDVGYPGLVVISDPAVVQRSDGSYVMYFKGLGLPDSDPDPRDHMLFRATSADGINNWVADSKPLVMGASVPGVARDRTGKVWIYFLYFGDGWTPTPTKPEHMERPYVIWENTDGSVSSPQPVVFFPAQHEVDPPYPLSFYNDPDPVLNPAPGEKGYCPAKTVVPRP